MTYKTHLSFGLLLSSSLLLLLLQVGLTPVLTLNLVAATVLGLSAPDLDTPSGEAWHKIPAGSILSRIIHPVFIGGHRHLSHSLIGFAIFSGLFYTFVKFLSTFNLSIPVGWITLAFIIGLASHIIADMFTEEGVPILFPYGLHLGLPPIKKVRIKTGHWFENLVVYPVVNLALILVIYLYISHR